MNDDLRALFTAEVDTLTGTKGLQVTVKNAVVHGFVRID
jgi:hypothetical protein